MKPQYKLYAEAIFRLLLVIFIISCFVLGILYECKHDRSRDSSEAQGLTIVDTIRYIDTIRYYMPVAKAETSLGCRIKFVPVYVRKGSNDSIQPTDNNAGGNKMANIPDSVAVEIAISQKEYEGKEYHAWVSGYEPSLDSIYVYPRHEIVTIREPPDKRERWGIGVFAGYGITPQGFQPCAGISVNYNILSF